MAGLGLVVLLGWVFDLAVLKSLTPGLPSMKAYTAAGLVLIGVALLILSRGQPTGLVRVIAAADAVLVGLLGVITLGQYLVGGLVVAGVRFDTAVFADTGTYPGRASPHTAVAFVAVAGALLAAEVRPGWGRRAFRVFLALLGVVLLTALVGYAFGVDYLRGVSSTTGMAVHTALVLVVVWVGLAWLPVAGSGVPEFHRDPRPSAVLVRRVAPVVLFVPVVLGLLRLEGQRLDLYDLRVGTALFSLAVILGLGAALVAAARSLDRFDAGRARAEQRYRATMDAMLDPCVLLEAVRDGHGRIVDFVYTYANPAACAYNQIPSDQLVGARLLDLLPGHVASGLLEMYTHVVETGRPLALDDFVYEHELLAQQRHYDVRATRVGDGLSYVWRDVTDQSQSRRALAASEARFRELVERAPDAVLVVDGAGQIALASQQAVELSGYKADELIGQPVELLVPPARRGVHTSHREAFLAHPTTRPMGAELTLALRHKDGHEVPVEISLSPLNDLPGSERLVAAAVRDTTDRTRAEAAIRASEERFRRVFDEAPIGMAMLGLDRRFTRVNPQLSRIVARPAHELEGVAVADITHPDDVASDTAGFDELMTGQADAYRTQKRYLRPDGSVVWANVSVGLLRDNEGRPVRLFSQVLDISEQKRIEGELQHLADHDHLTGLFNRRRFEEELDREVARSHRHGPPAAVLVLDIDRFKDVNDVLGHPAGDQLITGVAALCRNRLRVTDILARFGGDEFTALLPATGQEQARAVARDLRDAIEAHEFPAELAAANGGVTVSIGVAGLDGDTTTADQLLRHADIALYAAKDLGRNQVHVYRPGERQHLAGLRTSWTERLEKALDDDSLVLYAQPILAVNRGVHSWYELLVRLSDGERLILPGEFIPTAERSDLARRLDNWVIHQAVSLLAAHQRRHPFMRLGVNLSARSLTDPDLAQRVRRELEAAAANGAGLCFEITETAAITNLDNAITQARRLKDLGCQIALDDFGSGYSSFHYLKHLDIDYIKIDGEFIRDVGENTTNQLIVRSIIKIARGLGARAVAEYVEDQRALDLLSRYGVHYVQGFHVGMPGPLSDIDLSRPTAVPEPRAPSGARA